MTDPGNPSFKIDWEAWAAKNRHDAEAASVGTNWHAGAVQGRAVRTFPSLTPPTHTSMLPDLGGWGGGHLGHEGPGLALKCEGIAFRLCVCVRVCVCVCVHGLLRGPASRVCVCSVAVACQAATTIWTRPLAAPG